MLIAVTHWDMYQFDCQIRQAGDLPTLLPLRKSGAPGRKAPRMISPRTDRMLDCLDTPTLSPAGKMLPRHLATGFSDAPKLVGSSLTPKPEGRRPKEVRRPKAESTTAPTGQQPA